MQPLPRSFAGQALDLYRTASAWSDLVAASVDAPLDSSLVIFEDEPVPAPPRFPDRTLVSSSFAAVTVASGAVLALAVSVAAAPLALLGGAAAAGAARRCASSARASRLEEARSQAPCVRSVGLNFVNGRILTRAAASAATLSSSAADSGSGDERLVSWALYDLGATLLDMERLVAQLQVRGVCDAWGRLTLSTSRLVRSRRTVVEDTGALVRIQSQVLRSLALFEEASRESILARAEGRSVRVPGLLELRDRASLRADVLRELRALEAPG